MSTGQIDDERVQRVEIDFAEELGSEVLVHFSMAVRPVITPDISELLEDQGDSAESLGNRTKLTAHVSPRVDVKAGQQIAVLVDTEFLHFFDPDSGMAVTWPRHIRTTPPREARPTSR